MFLTAEYNPNCVARHSNTANCLWTFSFCYFLHEFLIPSKWCIHQSLPIHHISNSFFIPNLFKYQSLSIQCILSWIIFFCLWLTQLSYGYFEDRNCALYFFISTVLRNRICHDKVGLFGIQDFRLIVSRNFKQRRNSETKKLYPFVRDTYIYKEISIYKGVCLFPALKMTVFILRNKVMSLHL